VKAVTPAPPYPVVLRLEGRRCLVVGGGPIAARKVADLLACGAVVTVVAPELSSAIEELAAAETAGVLQLERRPYRRGEAANYRLVVTATGVSEVDRQAAEDAEAAGVWVNSADDADHCTFFLPSVHREGPVSIAVSTGGASPALAAWLRRRIGASLGREHLGTLAGLLEEGRQALRQAGRPTNAVDWRALLDSDLPSLVAAGRAAEARQRVDDAVAAAVHSAS
jgi:precorrin-2 dehydrogenase/sirohydrochlorin ferrochelatase